MIIVRRIRHILRQFLHLAGKVDFPVVCRQVHFTFGIHLYTRLQPRFALLTETEEAHPLVLEAVIDLLCAKRREHRIRLVFLIPFFLDVLADLTTKHQLALDAIRIIRSGIADFIGEQVEI